MTHSGIVDDVFGATVPNTNRPCRMGLVNRPTEPQVQFAIPKEGPAPHVGDHVTWGPHHVWGSFGHVDKLTYELDPSASLH